MDDKILLSVAEDAWRQHVTWGWAKPLSSVVANGQRVVLIGEKETRGSASATFHDFLVAVIFPLVFGDHWIASQEKKRPEEQHIAFHWRQAYLAKVKGWKADDDGIRRIPLDAAAKYLFRLCYDAAVVFNSGHLDNRLLHRLRLSDAFQGARFELRIRSIFLRAGFIIKLEDESDRRTTHCEFSAAWQGREWHYGVEVKSRHRPGIFGSPGKIADDVSADVSRLLKAALKKHTKLRRLIFIEMNVPDDGVDKQAPWTNDVAAQVAKLQQSPVKAWPPALVFFANEPFHYLAQDAKPVGDTCVALGLNLPEFRGPDTTALYERFPGLHPFWISYQQWEVPNEWPPENGYSDQHGYAVAHTVNGRVVIARHRYGGDPG